MNGRMTIAAAIMLVSLAACAGGDDTGDSASIEETSGRGMSMGGMDSMAAMEGMAGMGAIASASMMDQMQSHMARMRGAGDDSIAAVMPMHRQMLANMIAQMNREMRDMGMAPDQEWEATIDSLRSDLRTMPEMTPAEMQSAMEAHHARIDRVIGMHRSMMEQMSM
jgi:hypothetical protein